MEEQRKRFLSRTARYSGLLNILDFVEADASSTVAMTSVLNGADAWLAFNVARENVRELADVAVKAGVKRVREPTIKPTITIVSLNSGQCLRLSLLCHYQKTPLRKLKSLNSLRR